MPEGEARSSRLRGRSTEAARIAPVDGSPALRISSHDGSDPTLVVADIHLGLGAADRWAVGPPEGAAQSIAESLRALAERTGARTIVVAGDVKHPIVGTPGPLRPVVFDFFSALLVDRLAVEVVLGNHDVGLVPHLPKEVVVHPASGVIRHGVGIFHGHCWPSPALRAQRTLVAGHLHPGFRFAPTATATEPKQRCWVRTTFAPPAPPEGRKRVPRRRFEAREMIVLPAYHPLAGTEALNRARPSRGRSFLFARFLALGTSRLYLLDGTDLGPLKIPATIRRKRAPRRSPPGR